MQGEAAPAPRHLDPRSGRTRPLARPRRRGDDGAAVAVTEAGIEAALPAPARIGLHVEPTCAAAAAAFANLIDSGTIGREETTRLVLTGTGLKATQRTAALPGMEA